MSEREPNSETPKVPDSKTIIVLLGTIADTTWRMFTPVIALLILGLWLDSKHGTEPWFALSGVLIGFGAAIGLIWQQYRHINGGSKPHAT